MRFGEIREIRISDEIRKREEEEIWRNGVGKIKPESDITIEECNKFWDDLFSSMCEEN